MSETDNFIRIEMTAVASAVEVIEGETLLWEEFLYSLCEDPSLNSATEEAAAQRELCQECKASSTLLSACRGCCRRKCRQQSAALLHPESLLTQGMAGHHAFQNRSWSVAFLLYGCLQLATWLSLAALFPAQVAAGCWTLIPEGRGPSISEVWFPHYFIYWGQCCTFRCMHGFL